MWKFDYSYFLLAKGELNDIGLIIGPCELFSCATQPNEMCMREPLGITKIDMRVAEYTYKGGEINFHVYT